jgi:hypothetical protein
VGQGSLGAVACEPRTAAVVLLCDGTEKGSATQQGKQMSGGCIRAMEEEKAGKEAPDARARLVSGRGVESYGGWADILG